MQMFNVQGMTCGHCIRGLTHALQGADPTSVVDIDLAEGTLKVRTHLGAQEVVALIHEEGYHAEAA